MHALISPRRLRLLAAATIAAGLIAFAFLWTRLALDPAGQFGIDFADYYVAAQRLLVGDVPYAPEMMEGPIDAQGLDRYRYPPPLAVWLMPLALLPIAVAKVIWFATQLIALVAALIYVARRAGVVGLRDQLLCAGVAFVAFGPVFDALHKGNVSGFLAAIVAIAMFAASGAAAAAVMIGALVKLTPAALLGPLVLRKPSQTLRGASLAAALVIAPTLLTIASWQAYAVVLPNLLTGSADYATNATLPIQLSHLVDADLLRLGTIGLSLFFGGWALVLARSGHDRAAAITAATVATLLFPTALWWHYTVALLPALLYALIARRTLAWRLAILTAAAPIAWGGSSLATALAVPVLGAVLVTALRTAHE